MPPTKTELQAAAARARTAKRRTKLAKLVHTPTTETRRIVWCMAAVGAEPEAIAKAMRVTKRQLQKIYYDELSWGMQRAAAEVVVALFKVATDPNHPNFMPAAKFWLSSKAEGWDDKVSIDAKVRTQIEGLRYADDDTLIAIARRSLEGIRETEGQGRPH